MGSTPCTWLHQIPSQPTDMRWPIYILDFRKQTTDKANKLHFHCFWNFFFFFWRGNCFWNMTKKLVKKYSVWGTPFLRQSAYKIRVGGVSRRCGIEQIRVGGNKGRPCPSQSEQYHTLLWSTSAFLELKKIRSQIHKSQWVIVRACESIMSLRLKN